MSFNQKPYRSPGVIIEVFCDFPQASGNWSNQHTSNVKQGGREEDTKARSLLSVADIREQVKPFNREGSHFLLLFTIIYIYIYTHTHIAHEGTICRHSHNSLKL